MLAPVPFRTAVVTDVAARLIPTTWTRWFQSLKDAVDRAAQRVAIVTLTGQAAALTTTALNTGLLTDGLYRVSWQARITQAATTSSSLTVTLGWTAGGVACSTSGAALTGNTPATVQSGAALVHADAGSVLTAATAYASVGATAMQYELTVIVEQVSA